MSLIEMILCILSQSFYQAAIIDLEEATRTESCSVWQLVSQAEQLKEKSGYMLLSGYQL